MMPQVRAAGLAAGAPPPVAPAADSSERRDGLRVFRVRRNCRHRGWCHRRFGPVANGCGRSAGGVGQAELSIGHRTASSDDGGQGGEDRDGEQGAEGGHPRPTSSATSEGHPGHALTGASVAIAVHGVLQWVASAHGSCTDDRIVGNADSAGSAFAHRFRKTPRPARTRLRQPPTSPAAPRRHPERMHTTARMLAA